MICVRFVDVNPLLFSVEFFPTNISSNSFDSINPITDVSKTFAGSKFCLQCFKWGDCCTSNQKYN